MPLPRLVEQYRALQKGLYEMEPGELKLLIQRIVPEYSPYLESPPRPAFSPAAKPSAKVAPELPVSPMPFAAGNA